MDGRNVQKIPELASFCMLWFRIRKRNIKLDTFEMYGLKYKLKHSELVTAGGKSSVSLRLFMQVTEISSTTDISRWLADRHVSIRAPARYSDEI
jgi:hypothetical protein